MEILDNETNIGLIRNNNEDAVKTINHPKNKNIKLLLIADGMGGKQHGEVASNFVADEIEKYFINKDFKTFNNMKRTESLIKRLIIRLNKKLIKDYGENKLGTTLTMAIVNKNKTIIFNIGDSRAYIYKDKKLTQVTEDDSAIWMYYKYGEVEKDDLRYFSSCNIITSCVGISKDFCSISTIKIKNDYDILLLFSDGVTDLITDKKIQKIVKSTKKSNIIKKIVNEAVYQDQHLTIPTKLERKNYDTYIVPVKGRDNATGAIYIKKV